VNAVPQDPAPTTAICIGEFYQSADGARTDPTALVVEPRGSRRGHGPSDAAASAVPIGRAIIRRHAVLIAYAIKVDGDA